MTGWYLLTWPQLKTAHCHACEDDPEKWDPVLGKVMLHKSWSGDGDSKKSHPAPSAACAVQGCVYDWLIRPAFLQTESAAEFPPPAVTTWISRP